MSDRVTADSITDEQIRVLFGNGSISVDDAHEALNATVWPRERRAAERGLRRHPQRPHRRQR